VTSTVSTHFVAGVLFDLFAFSRAMKLATSYGAKRAVSFRVYKFLTICALNRAIALTRLLNRDSAVKKELELVDGRL